MAIGRPVEPVNLSPTVRQEIILITKSRTMPYALVQSVGGRLKPST